MGCGSEGQASAHRKGTEEAEVDLGWPGWHSDSPYKFDFTAPRAEERDFQDKTGLPGRRRAPPPKPWMLVTNQPT